MHNVPHNFRRHLEGTQIALAREARVLEEEAQCASHTATKRADGLLQTAALPLATLMEPTTFLSFRPDKWDSAKTIVPYWARDPSFLGAPERHKMLQQHVLGVTVQGSPHTYYLYTFNDNLKGDGSMNIEGIRRTLVKHFIGGKTMPRTLYIQAENASDNKNFAMIGFLAALVQHDYCNEVQLSFLLVGHTHEDTDQFFSVLTRHLVRLGVVKTPQAFQIEVQKAAAGKQRIVDGSTVDAVLDWTMALKPCKPSQASSTRHSNRTTRARATTCRRKCATRMYSASRRGHETVWLSCTTRSSVVMKCGYLQATHTASRKRG